MPAMSGARPLDYRTDGGDGEMLFNHSFQVLSMSEAQLAKSN